MRTMCSEINKKPAARFGVFTALLLKVKVFMVFYNKGTGFRDNRQMVARLSALRTGRLYPQQIPDSISVRCRVDPRAVMRPEGLRQ